MKKNFLIIGGDLRQLKCAEDLQKKGYDVRVYGFYNMYLGDLNKADNFLENLKDADYILLPLPVTNDDKTVNAPLWDGKIELSEIYQNVKNSTLIFGGMIKETLMNKLIFENVYDYAKNEEFLIKNSMITAEGAFNIIFSETPISVFGSKLLVVGYGRLGKIIAKLSKTLGAKTAVSARKTSDLSWIEVEGYHGVTYSDLPKQISDFDIIINTVPYRIFDKELISKMNNKVLLLDLASAPGGCDMQSAKDESIKAIWALSLPGKIAPYSSGKIISDTITNIIK